MIQHEVAVRNFCAQRPAWKRRELRKTLNELFDDAPIHALGFIPDAFCVDEENCTVHLFEADGSSRTDAVKLQNICELWYILDALGWSCTLTTLHLVTGAMSRIDDAQLAAHWWGFTEPQA